MIQDIGKQFYVDVNKAKAPSKYVFKGSNYRISIISDVVIRFEYSTDGSFSDYPTLFAKNRSFGNPQFTVQEDSKILVIKGRKYTLEYRKDKNFVGPKMLPEDNLKVMINGTDKMWYFNHSEVRNYMASSYSLDENKNDKIKYEKGLFSLDGFVSFDDSKTPLLNKFGNVISPNFKNLDTYLFIYNDDFGTALKDYLNLTGTAPLIPRYALGLWWYKNEEYTQEELKKLVEDFKKHQVPLSVIMLGDYARSKFDKTDISFTLNKNIFDENNVFSKYMKNSKIKLGLNIKTDGNISPLEEHFEEFVKESGKDKTKNIELNMYDPKIIEAFFKTIMNPLLNKGIDFLWLDDNNPLNKVKNYTSAYYINKNFSIFKDKRNFLISRNNGISSHLNGALYSGNTKVSWKTLKKLPFYNASASNLGLSWWSHDIGGFTGGTEDAELFMRYVQFGVYSPIMRLSSDKGKYYKREPWRWDAKTEKIVTDYIKLRYRLIPYIYSEARKYSTLGSTLIQPLYYKYPETFDEPLYKNEYYFGSEFFIAPITDPKDTIMDRVVHRIFLPKGIWYDFKTGKKFIGGKRYTTFYKDEDYPVYVSQGAIIPMSILDNENLNDLSPSKKLEIQVFPGRSNLYKLYEDDGETNMYKQGYSFTTQIEYKYKENDYSLELTPLEGKIGVLPEQRSYVIRFRNTKFTEDVQVFAGEVSIPFKRYVDNNDFIVEFDNIPVSNKIFIYCKGKDIEINAMRLINEDLESIISDVKVETSLKEKIDEILFSDDSIRIKRINIRKLKIKGLDSVFVKMFIKLLEYVSEI